MKSSLVFFTLCILFTVFATVSASVTYKPRKRTIGEWRVARATLMEHYFVKRDGENDGNNTNVNTGDNTNNVNDNQIEYSDDPVTATYVNDDANSTNPGDPNPLVDGESRKKANTTTSQGQGQNVGAKITFFEGNTLKNAFCYGDGKLPSYDAKPTDYIGAMNMIGKTMCYKCVEIKCGSKSIIVKIIDKCATCGSRNDIDLTLAAFKELAPPVKGIVQISWRPLTSCPSTGKWPTLEEKNKN
ncbi:20992_t:CDS:1 [Cetraspora pellucida]|uniref:20992_t:CDS:1 n=1 Tax=Cetraspora pellucida TaxID=1433469 RepID=A0A9N9NJQ6_9GLOM|nr:20992_t:CDS:1 [Cetraspora pellucida]